MNKLKTDTHLIEMAVNGGYFDNVLIKLKRKYSKNETISALSKKLTEVEIELGKSIAYIQELEHEKQCFESYKLKNQNNELEAKKDKLYIMRSEENSKLNSELKKIRKTNKELVNKIYLLENKMQL